MTDAVSQPEKRSVRRFPMNLPIKLSNAHGANGELHGYTRDVSSRGAFMLIDSEFTEGTMVDFLMTLPAEITLAEPIRVRCQGRVLRVERRAQDAGIAVVIEKYDFVGVE